MQTLIRSLRTVPVDGELVRLDGHVLTVESTATGARWTVEAGAAPPPGFAPRLMTRQAFEAMRDGTILESGAIAWQGKQWAIRDVWDGARMVAEISELPQTAP